MKAAPGNSAETAKAGFHALLDDLDRNGLAANNVVIYTSDQGFVLGDHGLFDNRFMYEEADWATTTDS